MKLIKSFTFLILIVSAFSNYSFGQLISKNEDDYLYNKIVTVRGVVKAQQDKNETLAIAVSAYLIFQRTDCKKCLVATRTDENGNYEIKVSEGKYRLIARAGTQEGKMYDVLALDQTRYIEVKTPKNKEVLDFNLLLSYPTNSLHRVVEK